MINALFVAQKNQFKGNPAIPTGLDLVDENNLHTHRWNRSGFLTTGTGPNRSDRTGSVGLKFFTHADSVFGH
jgi:hypothetical protein